MTASLVALPTFGAGGRIHVVVESPRGSAVKLKYEPDLEAIVFSRPLPDGVVYPFDWGFVPSTLGPDGDPVDAVVLHEVATFPGTVIGCRPLAVLEVRQTEKGKTRRNDRLVFQPIVAEEVRDDLALTARLKRQLEQFFLSAALGTGKKLHFLGWRGAEAAHKAVVDGAKTYAEKRGAETSTRRHR
ncbi:MAG: inorganic diphosphatase [Alphaproteobacteria bacterium]|nr:inorganic diphosphatase [Alphaproteobacteria bacterium]MBL6938480.1 inorganic diphosphatase [Alphaproteobacteria bacterium]MBL7096539.1 inorganic diphosphatase [Alphaproteobacteria bacterium]